MKKLKLGKLVIQKQVVSVLSDKQTASIKGGAGAKTKWFCNKTNACPSIVQCPEE